MNVLWGWLVWKGVRYFRYVWLGSVFCNGGMFGAGVFLVRDGPPPRNLPSPAGVLGAAPPSPISHKTGTANDQLTEKGMLILSLIC